MYPCINDRGLQLGASYRNRLLDLFSPGNVYSSIVVGKSSESTRSTDKLSLALAIGFLAMTASMACFGSVARINHMQWDARKSSFIREEKTELSKSPRGVAIALRVSNRAIGS